MRAPTVRKSWRALRQEPLVGLTRICPRQKMQRYPHRPVRRAPSNPLVTSSYYSRRPGPLARPILFGGLWQTEQRINMQPPPESDQFLSARCLWPTKIRPYVGRAGGTRLAHRPSAVRSSISQPSPQNSQNRRTIGSRFPAFGQLRTSFQKHPSGL